MTPTKSNLNKETCTPVSSNCVIWQGPDLPCINLCKGDTISEVTYRLALELCTIKDNFNFTDVDLTCLLSVCTTSPEPEKTLGNILNLIVNKICCLSDIVKNIDPSAPDEPYITIANCPLLRPYVDNQGNTLIKLPHSEYTYYLGVKLCTLYSQVQLQQLTLEDHEDRIKKLEDAVTPGIPQVTPDCLTGPGVVPGVPTDIDVVLNELEKQWCELVSALGTPANLTTAQGRQCVNLNNATPLSTGSGTMSGISGWVSTITNFSQSMNNLWLTVCDIRAAVKSIQDNCCKVSCSDLIVDFDAVVTINDDGDYVIRLFFGQTVVPNTWYDCDQTLQSNTAVYPYGWTGNKLTIRDSAGHTRDVYVQLRNSDLSDGILNDPTVISSGYDIVISGTNIDHTLPITLSGDVCLTDGSTTCVKCVSVQATFDPVGCCVITNSGSTANILTYKSC